METISLGEVVGLSEVNGLHEKFVAHLHAKSSCEIDFSKVEQIDTSGMQLISTFVHEGNKEGFHVVLKNIGDVVLERARLLGLEEVFRK